MRKTNNKCAICGIKNKGGYHAGIYYCNKHWLRIYLHGTPELQGRKIRSKFEIIGDICKITTSGGAEIIVDADDYEKVKDHSWCLNKLNYPVSRMSNNKLTRLSRFLLDLDSPDLVVDHINGNVLDNRRANLRICTNTQNARNCKLSKNNTSGYVGVRMTKSGKWHAQIMVNRKEINLGRYEKLEDAIKARREGEIRYFGEFAPHKNIEFFMNYKVPEEIGG